MIVLGALCLIAILGTVFLLKRKLKPQKRERMMVVMGSGGHTSEMLYILQNFNFKAMNRVVFALA